MPEPRIEFIRDAFRRMAIPKLRDPAALAARAQDFVDAGERLTAIASDQRIGTLQRR
jgi:hypothetical protein